LKEVLKATQISRYLGSFLSPRDYVLNVDFRVRRVTNLAFKYSIRSYSSGDRCRTAHH